MVEFSFEFAKLKIWLQVSYGSSIFAIFKVWKTTVIMVSFPTSLMHDFTELPLDISLLHLQLVVLRSTTTQRKHTSTRNVNISVKANESK